MNSSPRTPIAAIRKPLHLLPCAVAALCVAACGSTRFSSTWKEPTAQRIALPGKTIAAVYVTNDMAQRKAAEVYLANDLTNRGARGIASYTLLQDSHGDGEAARQRLKSAGVDGVIIMRAVGKDQQATYKPGSALPAYYRGFGRYYNYGYQTMFSSNSVATTTTVAVETLIYSLTDDKLLWAGTSTTANPDNLNTLVDDVADAVAKEVVKQGLLAK